MSENDGKIKMELTMQRMIIDDIESDYRSLTGSTEPTEILRKQIRTHKNLDQVVSSVVLDRKDE